ncbi:MAG: type II secretion system protein [Candidatus Sumerlaeota bacterium]|nr:type II secretion system protein [Candidatus Sumerlaeota bacterium]
MRNRRQPRPRSAKPGNEAVCGSFPIPHSAFRTLNSALRAPHSHGFTLLEIMVVLAIIGLLTGAIIPLFSNRQKSEKLKASALQLCDAFNYCYSASVTEGRRYRWSWNEENRNYQFLREADPIGSPGEFRPAMVGGITDKTLPDGITIEGIYFAIVPDVNDEDAAEQTPDLAPELNFYKDGHCDGAYIVLETVDPMAATQEEAEANAQYMTVSLNGITGRVKVIDGNAVAAQEETEGEETPKTNLFLTGSSSGTQAE